jgi:hypothetical protein
MAYHIIHLVHCPQQEDAIETCSRLSEFDERVSVAASRAESELSTVMDQFVAAFAAKRGKDQVSLDCMCESNNYYRL